MSHEVFCSDLLRTVGGSGSFYEELFNKLFSERLRVRFFKKSSYNLKKNVADGFYSE